MANGTTIYDILNFATSRTGPASGTYKNISVTVTMAQPVVLPAPGNAPDATQLAGFIFFDVDNNFADGTNFTTCGANGTYDGVDYLVDLVLSGGRLADGNYPIVILPAGTKVGEAAVSVSGDNVTFVVSIAKIGNQPAGPFNVGTALGNGIGPTDCAPNAGYATGAAAMRSTIEPVTTWHSWRYRN